MADEIQAAPEGTPVFQIQRMYLKDLSLEQPNAPHILLEQQQPQVDINLTLSAENVTDGIFEVSVTATVNTKVGDKTLFLVEAKQAGIFEIRNVPQEQLEGILGIVCPQRCQRSIKPCPDWPRPPRPWRQLRHRRGSSS